MIVDVVSVADVSEIIVDVVSIAEVSEIIDHCPSQRCVRCLM